MLFQILREICPLILPFLYDQSKLVLIVKQPPVSLYYCRLYGDLGGGLRPLTLTHLATFVSEHFGEMEVLFLFPVVGWLLGVGHLPYQSREISTV